MRSSRRRWALAPGGPSLPMTVFSGPRVCGRGARAPSEGGSPPDPRQSVHIRSSQLMRDMLGGSTAASRRAGGCIDGLAGALTTDVGWGGAMRCDPSVMTACARPGLGAIVSASPGVRSVCVKVCVVVRFGGFLSAFSQIGYELSRCESYAPGGQADSRPPLAQLAGAPTGINDKDHRDACRAPSQVFESILRNLCADSVSDSVGVPLHPARNDCLQALDAESRHSCELQRVHSRS